MDIQRRAPRPASEALEKYLAQQPRDIRAHFLLGAAHRANGKPDKATEAYRKVVALAPNDPRGPYFVGIGFRGQGRLEEAKKQFEAALALSPGFVDAAAELAGVAFAEKRSEVAIARVKKQIALAPATAG